MLESGILAFSIFANHDEVDVVVARLQSRDASARAEVRVELKCFAQREIERNVPGADRRGKRSFERDRVLSDGRKGLLDRKSTRLNSSH